VEYLAGILGTGRVGEAELNGFGAKASGVYN